MSDQQLIEKLKEDKSVLKQIYTKHKSYSVNYIRKMIFNEKQKEFAVDIYHDAVILFYNKVRKEEFELSSNIQTFIIGICRNRVLEFIKEPMNDSIDDGDAENSKQIQDNNPTNFGEPEIDEKEERIVKIEKGFEKMKKNGGKCYEILYHFYYLNKSLLEIAQKLNYPNPDTVKNQKSRCQKSLKELVINN